MILRAFLAEARARTVGNFDQFRQASPSRTSPHADNDLGAALRVVAPLAFPVSNSRSSRKEGLNKNYLLTLSRENTAILIGLDGSDCHRFESLIHP
jgi:hypothetical protein